MQLMHHDEVIRIQIEHNYLILVIEKARIGKIFGNYIYFAAEVWSLECRLDNWRFFHAKSII